MSLRSEAMIVRLSVSQWTARKFDKKVTQKVAEEYGTAANAGRYNKVLIATEAIQAITKTVSAARAFHYQNTCPWDDFGGRLLPSLNFETYAKGMRKLKAEFETAVSEFVSNYAEYREEARRRLNGMFNDADYPGAQAIKYKYGLTTDIEPVPDSEDFRVDIKAKDVDKLRKELEGRIADREAVVDSDLFNRLLEVIEHYSEKLNDPDAIFRDSLVDNLVELTDLLPKLNVTGNKNLAKIAEDSKKKLCGYDPQQLRNDPEVRSEAAEQAAAIMKKMAGYTG